MSIYFLRHASAGEPMKNLKKDERRPLDDDGVLQCRYIGRALGAMGVNARQGAADVKRLREKGTWKGTGERPKE